MMLSSAGILDKAPGEIVFHIIVMPPFNINNKLMVWRSFGNGAAKGSPFFIIIYAKSGCTKRI